MPSSKQTSDGPSERRFWPPVSRHIHVLGETRRVRHGDGSIAALYLYEQSVCRGNEPTDLPPSRADALIGACNGIQCTICGERIDWGEQPAIAYKRVMSLSTKMYNAE